MALRIRWRSYLVSMFSTSSKHMKTSCWKVCWLQVLVAVQNAKANACYLRYWRKNGRRLVCTSIFIARYYFWSPFCAIARMPLEEECDYNGWEYTAGKPFFPTKLGEQIGARSNLPSPLSPQEKGQKDVKRLFFLEVHCFQCNDWVSTICFSMAVKPSFMFNSSFERINNHW